jgi:hypothetical protein
MAPILIGIVLTVASVYAFMKIHKKELFGGEDWLIRLAFLFMLYGLYT